MKLTGVCSSIHLSKYIDSLPLDSNHLNHSLSIMKSYGVCRKRMAVLKRMKRNSKMMEKTTK